MKKHTLLTGVVLGSLLLTGCKSQTTTPPSSDTKTAAPTEAAQSGSMSDKLKSWADAVKVGGGLKCTVTDTKKNMSSQIVAKGKKMHMSGLLMTAEGNNATGAMISDGSILYTWDTVKKEGMKMTLPSEEELKKSAEELKKGQPAAPETPDFTDAESVKKFEENGLKMDCSPAVISDSEFVPPTDVKFQDLSEMMKSLTNDAQKGMTEEQKKALEDAMQKTEQ